MHLGLARTVVVRVAIAVALISATAAPAAGADPLTDPVPTWVPDGEVKSVAVSGSTAYIGGNFTRIGPYTGSSALFEASNGVLKKPWPEVEGVVNAVASDGSGGWFLGGDFRSVGGLPRTDLAHVMADRSVDPNWTPTTNGTVRALAVDNPAGAVYAGGGFSSANGGARTNLAGFTRAGALTSFTGGVTQAPADDFGGIHVLLLDGPTLYAGGIFNAALGSSGGGTRNRVAAFTVASSVVLPWNPNANHTVNGLALDPDGNGVFIGGRFNALRDNTASEVSRHGIAKVNETNGDADPNWIAPVQFGPELVDIAVTGDWIYLAGSNIRFNPGGPKFPAVALGVQSAALNTDWDPAVGAVTSLTATPSAVYLGGASATESSQLAVTGVHPITANSTGFTAALGRGKQQFPSGSQAGVYGIGVSGSDVVAGGTFTNAGGVSRRNLAAIDLNTGQATAFKPPLNTAAADFGVVNSVVITDDGLVWAGGAFDTEAPGPRFGLAAFDAGSGAIASFNRQASGGFSGIVTLAASGTTVYVGGGFNSIGGASRRNLAAVRNVPGTDGTVLPFDPDINGVVRTLAVDGDTLYLGGQFSEVNAGLAALLAERNNLAAVDATNGLARPWDPNTHGQVHALALTGDTVYAGGEFDRVNGSTPRQRVAAFDRQNGAARAWDPGADGPVLSLAAHGSSVFAGGDFAHVNGSVPRAGLAALDAQGGASKPLNVTLTPEERNGPLPPVARVNALFASPATGLLVGGGYVMDTPTLRAQNLAQFGLTPPPGGTPAGDASGGAGGPGGAGTTPADGIAPNLSGLTASARRFRVGPGATPADGTAAAAGARKKKAPRGTTLTLSLSEPARVRFEVLVKGKGRKDGKKCVK